MSKTERRPFHEVLVTALKGAISKDFIIYILWFMKFTIIPTKHEELIQVIQAKLNTEFGQTDTVKACLEEMLQIVLRQKAEAQARQDTLAPKASVSDADKVKALLSVIDNVEHFIGERIEYHLGQLHDLVARAKRISNASTPEELKKEVPWIL